MSSATRWVLFLLVSLCCSLPSRSLGGELPTFDGPTSSSIPSLTVFAHEPTQYVINGSFTGSKLTYAATLGNGDKLPDWMKFSTATGTFTIEAPASQIGNLLEVRVAATDADGNRATGTYHLTVGYSSPGCIVEANTDALGKLLDCTSGTVTLQGYTSAGSYYWTGPNGFFSAEQNPTVTVAGIYSLTSDGSDNCPRRSIVEVRPATRDCAARSDNNLIPVATVNTSKTTGISELAVQFDAHDSQDADGAVIDYFWTWDEGSASGPRPRIEFEEGIHEVHVLVMDNTGARSSTRLTVAVQEAPKYSEFWLEAECAQVGGSWQTISESGAANGKYVMSENSSMRTAPATAPDNYVRFHLEGAKEDVYTLHGRISAAGSANDSYWVRINSGAWTMWRDGIVNNGNFRWSAWRTPVSLREGNNTIDIAFREPDARLDKIYLTNTSATPSGTGRSDASCRPNELPLAVAVASSREGTAPFAVTLDGSDSFDPDGTIAKYEWAWGGGSARGALPRPVLAAGEYTLTLTVTDDEGLTDTDVVAISVKPRPTPPPTTNPEESDKQDDNGGEMKDPTDDTVTEVATSTDFWLEAECAEVGGRWTTATATDGSNETYVVVERGNSPHVSPGALAANRVTFSVYLRKPAEYSLFARIKAPSPHDDSFWVRVNDGKWYKWFGGLDRSGDFEWNQYPQELSLAAGDNTVEFAYREDGTALDKIHLNRTATLPQTAGPTGSNCDQSSQRYAYDMDCATVGDGWEEIRSSEAAGGSYLIFKGPRRTAAAPENEAAHLISLEVDVEAAGEHHLFVRLNAPNSTQNSIWVQVDGGKWIKFWQQLGGAQLLTRGFEWREVNRDGEHLSFQLTAGRHTIRLANREPGTRVDRLLLSRVEGAPRGFGPTPRPCASPASTTIVRGMMATTTPTVTVTEPTLSLALYPNPTVAEINYRLDSDFSGPVAVLIYDTHGRRISERTDRKDGNTLTGSVDVAELPSGMYLLRLQEADRQTVKPFVKR